MIEVPDFVGKPFHVARDEAAVVGLSLANLDPDGPPVGALAWPGLFYVTEQSPAGGTKVVHGTDVVISISSEPPSDMAPARHR